MSVRADPAGDAAGVEEPQPHEKAFLRNEAICPKTARKPRQPGELCEKRRSKCRSIYRPGPQTRRHDGQTVPAALRTSASPWFNEGVNAAG